jgi:hypothetical protein
LPFTSIVLHPPRSNISPEIQTTIIRTENEKQILFVFITMSKNDLSKSFYYTNPPYWPADQTQGLKI